MPDNLNSAPAQGAAFVSLQDAIEQMIDHARRQGKTSEKDYNLLGKSMEATLGIARRGGFDGQASLVVEDFIVNQLGED